MEITFGLKVFVKGLPDCDNVFAFQYGSVLLSADLGRENMIDGKTGVDVTIPTNKIVKNEHLTISEGTVAAFMQNIDSRFERSSCGDLGFTLRGTDQELTFRPHYLKTRERYGIYWYFLDNTEDQGDQVAKRMLEEKRRENILDVVQPGYGQYENDEFHAMEDNGSVSATSNGTTRHATAGGNFGYYMKVEEGKDLLLELHFLREDNGKLLRISIGEEEIFSKRLHYTGKEEEYVVELSLSRELIQKHLVKRKIEGTGEVPTVFVKFQGGMFVESARLYRCLFLYVCLTKQFHRKSLFYFTHIGYGKAHP